jgi:hypothetical protein
VEVRPWRVALAAVDEVGEKRGRGRNKNMSGIAVTLTDGDEEVFVARVAFARRNSRHPEADFAEQLEAETDLCHVARDGDWRSGGAETACGLFIDEPPCCESYDQQPPACGRPRCPECLMNVREEDGE